MAGRMRRTSLSGDRDKADAAGRILRRHSMLCMSINECSILIE